MNWIPLNAEARAALKRYNEIMEPIMQEMELEEAYAKKRMARALELTMIGMSAKTIAAEAIHAAHPEIKGRHFRINAIDTKYCLDEPDPPKQPEWAAELQAKMEES